MLFPLSSFPTKNKGKHKVWICSKSIIFRQAQILTSICASCRIVSEEFCQKCMTKISAWSVLQRFLCASSECLRLPHNSWAPCCPLASVASTEVTLCLFSPGTEGMPRSATPQKVGWEWENHPGSFACANQLLLAEMDTTVCSGLLPHILTWAAGRPLLPQINSGVIAELGIFHFTYICCSNSLGTKGLLEPPECPSSPSPQKQTPPIIDIFNKQSLSHEAVGEKYLATRQQ